MVQKKGTSPSIADECFLRLYCKINATTCCIYVCSIGTTCVSKQLSRVTRVFRKTDFYASKSQKAWRWASLHLDVVLQSFAYCAADFFRWIKILLILPTPIHVLQKAELIFTHTVKIAIGSVYVNVNKTQSTDKLFTHETDERTASTY